MGRSKKNGGEKGGRENQRGAGKGNPAGGNRYDIFSSSSRETRKQRMGWKVKRNRREGRGREGVNKQKKQEWTFQHMIVSAAEAWKIQHADVEPSFQDWQIQRFKMVLGANLHNAHFRASQCLEMDDCKGRVLFHKEGFFLQEEHGLRQGEGFCAGKMVFICEIWKV